MRTRLVLAVLFMVRSPALTQSSGESDSTSHFGAHDSVELDEQVRILKSVPPKYPESAVKDSVQGQVFVDVLIDTNGNVEKAAVCKNVRGDLDSAALHAVEHWKFSPAKINGELVKVGIHLCFNFFLPKDVRLKPPADKKSGG